MCGEGARAANREPVLVEGPAFSGQEELLDESIVGDDPWPGREARTPFGGHRVDAGADVAVASVVRELPHAIVLADRP